MDPSIYHIISSSYLYFIFYSSQVLIGSFSNHCSINNDDKSIHSILDLLLEVFIFIFILFCVSQCSFLPTFNLIIYVLQLCENPAISRIKHCQIQNLFPRLSEFKFWEKNNFNQTCRQ